MKLAVIYSDKRGRYIAQGCSSYCDVTEIDLSEIAISSWKKYISILISVHKDRNHWRNDSDRNPLAVKFRETAGNEILKKKAKNADAVLQFGLMTQFDYSMFGCPKIYIYHDGAYDPGNPYWFSPRYGNWFRNKQAKWFRKYYGIFVFSEWAMQQHIQDYDISEKVIRKVGWGPCSTLDDNLVKQRYYANKFVFIGGEPWRKGLDVLLSAFKQIRRKYDCTSLEVIGTNGDQFKNLASPGVTFHGYCDMEKILSILYSSDIFVLPSRYDRSPHAIIEAMWYGLPEIVTNTCGSPEPVNSGDCGLIIDPDDTDELVRAMESLIKNPGLVKSMSQKAIYSSRKYWTWEKVCYNIVRRINEDLMGNV